MSEVRTGCGRTGVLDVVVGDVNCYWCGNNSVGVVVDVEANVGMGCCCC